MIIENNDWAEPICLWECNENVRIILKKELYVEIDKQKTIIKYKNKYCR